MKFFKWIIGILGLIGGGIIMFFSKSKPPTQLEQEIKDIEGEINSVKLDKEQAKKQIKETQSTIDSLEKAKKNATKLDKLDIDKSIKYLKELIKK